VVAVVAKVGSKIGSYWIERELGRGGFGVVYAGVDRRLGRRAAIKQLRPEHTRDREIVERFFNEARAAAGIDHPGIVEIYDVGWHDDGSAYFAMKLLDGESYGARLRALGRLPVATACAIARQIASALVAAHARGIIHRDLKPDNVILVPDDEVAIGERATLLDFGIAKLRGEDALSSRTRTGIVMGTPSYMSPEQCRGAGEADARSDVYALACILFESLAGRPPFVGAGSGAVLGMHQFVAPPDVRAIREDTPPELAELIARSLAKDPADRPSTEDLAVELRPFAQGGASERIATARSERRIAATVVGRHSAHSDVPVIVAGHSPHSTAPHAAMPLVAPHVAHAAAPSRARRRRNAIAAGALAGVVAGAVALLAWPSRARDTALVSGAFDARHASTVAVDAAPSRTVAVDAAPSSTVVVGTADAAANAAVGGPADVTRSSSRDATADSTRSRDATASPAAVTSPRVPPQAPPPRVPMTPLGTALAACQRGDLEGAARYIGELPATQQAIARDACARRGVRVDIGSMPPRPPPPRSTLDGDLDP
jgi:serine/threonine-protein kinase